MSSENVNSSRINVTEVGKFLFDIKYIVLFYVIGDFFTTMHALQYGFEENGFLSIMMDQYGVWSLLILKILFLGLVYYNYLAIKSAGSKWLNLFWSASKKVIALAGIFLVINNTLVICGSYGLIQMIRLILL
jgi:hypothetical protein